MWQQTPDRRTWCAGAAGLVLTVTRVSSGQWRADVAGNRSPEFPTRLAAQAWAERTGGAR
jgi:hypothetical protein